jgi:hypothetical protein
MQSKFLSFLQEMNEGHREDWTFKLEPWKEIDPQKGEFEVLLSWTNNSRDPQNEIDDDRSMFAGLVRKELWVDDKGQEAELELGFDLDGVNPDRLEIKGNDVKIKGLPGGFKMEKSDEPRELFTVKGKVKWENVDAIEKLFKIKKARM